jgi:hypothetical protein
MTVRMTRRLAAALAALALLTGLSGIGADGPEHVVASGGCCLKYGLR